MIHNYYQIRGGEDESNDLEISLLQSKGHDVKSYSRHNDEIKGYSWPGKIRLVFSTVWSRRTYREVSDILADFRPEIVHVQNFFPLISPSIFWACSKARIPVLLSLRDYRLLCPLGWFFRKETVCEDCIRSGLHNAVLYRCYRKSFVQSSIVVLMLIIHRLLSTWRNKVTMFIALTDFSRNKFIEGGLPADKVVTRHNFIGSSLKLQTTVEKHVLFAGRLSSEKGIECLLNAWKKLPDIPLQIAGDGPMRDWIGEFISKNQLNNVSLLGRLTQEQIFEKLRESRFLVMPSIWYETFGRTIIEAFATGTPVLASRLGAMAELVKDNRNGMLFESGNPDDLAAKARELWNTAQTGDLDKNAFNDYSNLYSADKAYDSIMDIYKQAINLQRKA